MGDNQACKLRGCNEWVSILVYLMLLPWLSTLQVFKDWEMELNRKGLASNAAFPFATLVTVPFPYPLVGVGPSVGDFECCSYSW